MGNSSRSKSSSENKQSTDSYSMTMPDYSTGPSPKTITTPVVSGNGNAMTINTVDEGTVQKSYDFATLVEQDRQAQLAAVHDTVQTFASDLKDAYNAANQTPQPINYQQVIVIGIAATALVLIAKKRAK